MFKNTVAITAAINPSVGRSVLIVLCPDCYQVTRSIFKLNNSMYTVINKKVLSFRLKLLPSYRFSIKAGMVVESGLSCWCSCLLLSPVKQLSSVQLSPKCLTEPIGRTGSLYGFIDSANIST